jgi:hypothetical protein
MNTLETNLKNNNSIRGSSLVMGMNLVIIMRNMIKVRRVAVANWMRRGASILMKNVLNDWILIIIPGINITFTLVLLLNHK